MSQTVRYHRVAIILHWLIAGLILAIIPIGFLMGDAPDAVKLQIYQLHKTIGMSILFLSLVRLGWRLLNPPPALASTLKAWEKWASKFVHSLFYILMIGTPLVGWAVVSTSSRGTPTILFGQINWPHLGFLQGMEVVQRKQLHNLLEQVHEYAAFVILGLLVLHVGAALKHQFLDKDDTASKMVPGLTKTAQPPATKGRGLLALVIGLLALFASWVILGASSSATSSPSAMAVDQQQAQTNWKVDHSNSQIGFGYHKNGSQGFGQFGVWTANIFFEPDNLSSASLSVSIAAASAHTGDAENDESLPGPGWLNTGAHPQIIWTSTRIEQVSEGHYLAKGELSLRGMSIPFDLAFQLTIDEAGTAHMVAQTSLNRLTFGIGADDDGAAAWVDNLVTLQMKVTAAPVLT